MQEFIFENQSLNGNVKPMKKISKKLDEILEDAGFLDVNSKTFNMHYYTFSIDKKSSKNVKGTVPCQVYTLNNKN